VPYDALTESMVSTFKSTLFNKAILGEILADRLKEMTAGSDGVREEITALRAEVAKLERRWSASSMPSSRVVTRRASCPA